MKDIDTYHHQSFGREIWMKQTVNRSMTLLATAVVSVVLLSACQQRPEGSSSGSSSGASSTDTTSSGSERSVTSDTAITAKVKSALLADSKVKSTDINVETNKGEVILSGFVDSDLQMDQAIKVAGTVDGVKKVTNKMKARK